MPNPLDTATPWLDRHRQLAELATCQLFFIGGAPRSGTTWVQELLDLHPDISCRAEALFHQDLARPLDTLMHARSQAIAAKNQTTFRHGKGFPPPTIYDTDIMLGTAVLLALQRQCAGRAYAAIGEKTPENVFLFPRLRSLFPQALFIGIARDPRDSLSSAWHFWAKRNAGSDAPGALAAFVEASLPAVELGLQTFAAYLERIPEACRIITYEQLIEAPEPITADLCRFLGVSDDPATIRACVAGAAFPTITGGRQPGQTLEGAFHRKGIVGDWTTTMPPDLAARITTQLDWAYRRFGWPP